MMLILEDFLKPDEVERVWAILAKGETVDGLGTAGEHVRALKRNLEIRPRHLHVQEVQGLLGQAFKRNRDFQAFVIPKRLTPPIFNRYEEGMAYDLHVDNPFGGVGDDQIRSDLSVTVFLTDPADYGGGELYLQTPLGDREVKLAAGGAVVYPTSFLHQVKPVTRGTRTAAIIWIQSHVRDPARREILRDVQAVMDRAHADQTQDAGLLSKIYSNLLKLWAEG